MKKAQAALEFLMTYGWAILVVLIVIGALAYFGVLNPSILMGNRCTVETGFNCKDFQAKEDSSVVLIKLENTMGRGVMINQVNLTGEGFGDSGCSITPSTVLPRPYTNPLSDTFNGNQGLRLTDGASQTIPLRCFSSSSGNDFGGSRAKGDISIQWYQEYASPTVSHTALGEVLTKLKKGQCTGNGFYIIGPDATGTCCPNTDDYVLDSQCFRCPQSKPNLAYTNTLDTGHYSDEVAFTQGTTTYVNNTARLIIPCGADVYETSFDVANYRNFANDTSYFSTVILTDVSGSMGWRFFNSNPGTIRPCTTPLIFDSTTQRLSLAKCTQTGINYTGFSFEGVIPKLLTEFSGNRVGLVTFQSTTQIISGLSTDIAGLSAQVNTYVALGGTMLEDGMVSAVNVLQTNNPNNINYIILISDGDESFGSDVEGYTCGPTFPTNISVYILGIGPAYQFQAGHEGDCNFLVNPLNQPLCIKMKNIASCTDGGFYSAMDPQGTVDALNQILGMILQFPSNLNVAGVQYSGLLKGTYSVPDYIEPRPNVTSQIQTLSNSCGSSSTTYTISMSSESIGVVDVNSIRMVACTAGQYP